MEKSDIKKLFEEFDPVSDEEWEQVILSDLKGQDYGKKLIWNTTEGIKLLPYYRDKVYQEIDVQGHDDIIRFGRNYSSWMIGLDISETDPELANTEARQYIDAGVNAIGLNARYLNNVEKVGVLLKGLELKNTWFSFSDANCYRFLRGLLNEYLVLNNEDYKDFRGCFDHDPLTFFIENGYISDSFNAMAQRLAELFDTVHEVLPEFKALNIRGDVFQNSGADAVLELAFVFSILVEYIDMLTERGLKPDSLFSHFQLTFGTGASYFTEIAKLRAARLMWYHIVNQYPVRNDLNKKAFIQAVCTKWNMSCYDAHTNILRSTTEAMSAVIGGADLIKILPFDSVFRKPDDFSKRIAKNILLLLKEESHFDKVVDPAAGSYYVEYLTDAIYKKAWELFLETENKGGFFKAVEEGFIQDLIYEKAAVHKSNIRSGKEKILGVNLYPDITEKILDKIDSEYFKIEEEVDIGVKVIQGFRSPEEFEDLRLKTEVFESKGGKVPVVFLFPFGNPGMASARQIFSRNFFGVAGYKIIENLRFTDFSAGIDKALEKNADIIVLCSSDEEYLSAAMQIVPMIKKDYPHIRVVVAGNPQSSNELLSAGVDDFIHIKTNLFEKLIDYHKLFKIIS